MKKLFKTKDGSVFVDITAKAQDILKSELFELYAMWEKNEHTYKLPIFYPEDIETAIKYGKHICIEVSDEKHVRELFKI